MTITTYTNTRVLISKIPEGVAPKASHFRTVTETGPAPELAENEVFVKNLIFSLDPYIRHEFPDGTTESSVVGFSIAKVIESKNSTFPVGATVFAPAHWATYSHIQGEVYINDVHVMDKIIDPEIPLAAYNGVLGVPGFTVYDSLNAIGDLKAGETIYISSAAGTLGQLAGQMAKSKGLRVIGSAGTDAKVAYLKNELGFDAAFNYKTVADKGAALAEAVGPQGLDIYYDLTGDDTIETVLELLNPRGRILAVGMLAGHQNNEPYRPHGLHNILFKQLRYEGYLVFERYGGFVKFFREWTPLVKEGKIKYTQTVLNGGVESIPQAYVDLLGGVYQGKVNVQIADA
ncbi:Prostaglandin reductase 1 [Gryganskiella cystojenkinii]|nr:Prostaglandin reductase 1 [Gryganskiella cystojenkinii]